MPPKAYYPKPVLVKHTDLAWLKAEGNRVKSQGLRSEPYYDFQANDKGEELDNEYPRLVFNEKNRGKTLIGVKSGPGEEPRILSQQEISELIDHLKRRGYTVVAFYSK